MKKIMRRAAPIVARPFVFRNRSPVVYDAAEIPVGGWIGGVGVCAASAEIPIPAVVPTPTIIPTIILSVLLSVLMSGLLGRTRRQSGDHGFSAAAIVARYRRVGDQTFAPAHQFQDGGVKAIDVLAQIQLPGLVDKRSLICDVDRDWALQVDCALVVAVHAPDP